MATARLRVTTGLLRTRGGSRGADRPGWGHRHHDRPQRSRDRVESGVGLGPRRPGGFGPGQVRPSEEHQRAVRYTGASLSESEDWIDQLKRKLDCLR